MAFQFSTTYRNNALDAFETTTGVSAVLRIRSGTPPANAGAVRSGTVLMTANLPSDWMANASGGSKGLSGTWQDAAADASGLAGHFEIMDSGLTTCHLQGLVSMAWSATTAVVVGHQMHANGNVYRCTVAGTTSSTAPSHTTGTATDGTVTWQFVQAGTDMTIQNTNIAVGQQVTVDAFTLTIGGA